MTLYIARGDSGEMILHVRMRMRIVRAKIMPLALALENSVSNGSCDVYTCIIMRNDKMALYYTEIAAKTWISLSKGTKPLLYRKDHARSKLSSFHVKL